MKFKTARNIVCFLYTAAAVILVAGVLGFSGETVERTISIIAGVVLIFVGAYFRLKFLVCPNCGERITGRLLDTTKCPKCSAELMPKKSKK